MLSIPCHRCGSIEEDEHFKTDLTLTSQNLPDRKDQLVSYSANLLQLLLGAVREHRNRGKVPQVVITNHQSLPFSRACSSDRRVVRYEQTCRPYSQCPDSARGRPHRRVEGGCWSVADQHVG